MIAQVARLKGAVVPAPSALARPGYVPGVTTVILTRDEDMHIARAIASVQGFSHEVLVVDSFSQDATCEIACSMGARVVQNPFVNHACQFRFALAECGIRTEWILRLDADEVIGADLAAELAATLPTLPLDVTGVLLNRQHMFMGRWVRHGGRYPLRLLRVWRNGLGTVEDRWMDEHVQLTRGRAVTIEGLFADMCERDVAFFIAKHNGYATREAVEVLARKHGLFDDRPCVPAGDSGRQARTKRWIKERVYNRLPFGVGPLAYFLYRYVVQLGFLDGRAGLIYHLLQGFWYRFLVDIRVLELERAILPCRSREERLTVLRAATGLKL